MPQFDLRGIKIAEYINTSGTISYNNAQSVGDAMNVNLDLRYAEGRLYAESTLAEYLRKATGGTISIGVKYIPEDAQKLMYGSRSKSRTIGSGQNTKTITSLQRGANDVPSYVGVAFYAPDMIDGEEKYTCVLVTRALFGPPGMSLQTMGESIVFQTPTTSGEFLPDHSASKELVEVAVCDTEADAKAWIDLVLEDE